MKGDCKICPNCNEKIGEHDRNCKYCGSFIAKTNHQFTYELEEEATVLSLKDDTTRKRICTKCGEVNKETAVLCYSCKTKLDQNQPVLDKNKDYLGKILEKEERKEQIRFIFRAAFIILNILINIVFVVLSHKKGIDQDATGIFILILVITSIVNILFPQVFFYMKYTLWVQDAEPTDAYLTLTRVAGYVTICICTLCSVITYVIS